MPRLGPIAKMCHYDKVKKVLKFPNNYYIDFGSAERADHLEGFQYDRTIINEAGIVMKKNALWDNTIQPMTKGDTNLTRIIGCVVPDTMVFQDGVGIREIGYHDIGYKDSKGRLYGDGGYHEYTQLFGNGVSPTIKITDNYGYTIEGTPNHKLFTPDGWKRLDELKNGEKLYVQVGQGVFGNVEEDLDWCYFLGLYLAEGSIEEKGYRITITNQDQDVIDFLHKYGFKTSKDGIHHRISSKEFCKRWGKTYKKQLANYKTIPQSVMSFTKPCMAQFLSGYFDGDGHSDPNRRRVGCNSSSKRLIEQVHTMLLNFGIVGSSYSYITRPTKRVVKSCTGYRIEIGGYASHLFHKEIGFRIRRKQNNWTKVNRNLYRTWNNFDWSKRLPTDLCGVRYTKLISWHILSKLGIQTDRIGSYVKSIEHSEAYTSDFVVPETNQYCANGFISHNTPKGRNKFWELFNLGLTGDPRWASFKYSGYESPYWNPEELDQIKENVPYNVFQQEYMADFLENNAGVFRNIQACIRNLPMIREGVPGHRYVMGIDLAKHTDFTVITIADCATNQIVYFDRFNKIDWVYQRKKIVDTWEKFGHCRTLLDSTGIGDPVYDELYRVMGDKVEGYKINSATKKDLIEGLALALENTLIYYPNIEELISELDTYEYDISRAGTITYNAPSGLHDDIVISLAMTWQLLKPARNNFIWIV